MNSSCTALRVGIGVLLLAVTVVGEVITADAKSDYEIINTGIKGGGCWYDDNHFIVVKGQQPAPGQEFEVEGLYSLDPRRPKELTRLNLDPIEPSFQRHIRDVTCQDQTILFHTLTADKKRNTIYSLNLGQSPTVVVAKQEGFILPQAVNVRERYVLGVTHTIMEPHSPHTEQAVKDCNFANLMDGYRVFCLRHDRGTKRTWPADNVFLTKYLWDETIRVTKNGQYQWVPNPGPPLKRPDGTDFKQGYLLRDLENRIVQEISMKQDPYQVVDFELDSHGMYLYGVCYKVGDHGGRHYTQGGRICRLLLDGNNRHWEEVASIQKSPTDPFSLHDLDVNDQGDVVMIERGHRLVASLWKYSAHSKQVDKMLQASFPIEIGRPRVSPSGKWVSVIHSGNLVFVEQKGAQQ
jgi:hypothetical protein